MKTSDSISIESQGKNSSSAKKASLSHSKPRSPSAKYSLSYSKLRWVYLIIPFCAMIVFMDVFFLNRELQESLPLRPESLVWFAAIFELPHIFASSILFADREYLQTYWKRLVPGIIALGLSVFVLPKIISPVVFFSVIGIYTVYHVVGQQFGITGMFLRQKSTYFKIWKFCGIAAGTVIFAGVFVRHSVFGDFYPLIQGAPFVLISAMFYCGHKIQRASVPKVGRSYLWLNQILTLSALIFCLIGYPFFALVIPRVVHDLTAFMYYVTHDRNRNVDECKNLAHKPFRLLGIPTWALTPLLGVACGFIFRYFLNADFKTMLPGYYFVSAVHFYTDAFAWKNGSLLRKYIFFT